MPVITGTNGTTESNAGLTSAINEALAALKDDGTIESLEVKWFGSAM